MESTCTSEVLLGVFDSSCPSPHLSPYENKIGGYPVSTKESLVSQLIPINLPHSGLLRLLSTSTLLTTCLLGVWEYAVFAGASLLPPGEYFISQDNLRLLL